jgi:DNA-binding GntR family transcriptional regulator
MKDISIHVRPYGGKDPKKQAEYLRRVSLAQRIEQFLTEHMKNRTSAIVTYGAITEALGCSRDTVRELLQPSGGGENGITL